MQYNCLIIDDEEALSESTCEYFNMFDVKTYWVADQKKCYEFLADNTTDLILLDINLGETSGFEICKKLRETSDIPILFISARTNDDDILLALGIGGDDYIQKPYSLSVLLAKVKVVLKRCKKAAIIQPTQDKYHFGPFWLDLHSERLYKAEQEIKLKTMEYKLILYLLQNKNRTVSKDELFSNVWRDSFTGDSTLNVHIRWLREKIEKNPNAPQYIKTVWGKGYMFDINSIDKD